MENFALPKAQPVDRQASVCESDSRYGIAKISIRMAAMLVMTLAFSACTSEQAAEYRAKIAEFTPSQAYTVSRADGTKYEFVTHKSTYDDVVRQLGEPTKSGTTPSGEKVIMYRTFNDATHRNNCPPGGPACYNYQAYLSWLTISDMTFVFDRNALLVSVSSEDKTKDPEAIRWVKEQEQQQAGSSRTHDSSVNVSQSAAASPITFETETNFEMALIAKNGNMRCSWPLSQRQKNTADRRINEMAKHMNRIDYLAKVNGGLSVTALGYNTNADFCLDSKQKSRFLAAARSLHD